MRTVIDGVDDLQRHDADQAVDRRNEEEKLPHRPTHEEIGRHHRDPRRCRYACRGSGGPDQGRPGEFGQPESRQSDPANAGEHAEGQDRLPEGHPVERRRELSQDLPLELESEKKTDPTEAEGHEGEELLECVHRDQPESSGA